MTKAQAIELAKTNEALAALAVKQRNKIRALEARINRLEAKIETLESYLAAAGESSN